MSARNRMRLEAVSRRERRRLEADRRSRQRSCEQMLGEALERQGIPAAALGIDGFEATKVVRLPDSLTRLLERPFNNGGQHRDRDRGDAA